MTTQPTPERELTPEERDALLGELAARQGALYGEPLGGCYLGSDERLIHDVDYLRAQPDAEPAEWGDDR